MIKLTISSKVTSAGFRKVIHLVVLELPSFKKSTRELNNLHGKLYEYGVRLPASEESRLIKKYIK